MNEQELAAVATIANLNISFAATGHAEWRRGFLKTKDGVSIGRAVIQNGVFSHMKWYCKPTGVLGHWDYPIYSFDFAFHFNKPLSRQIYDSSVLEAEANARQDLLAKKAWREANPYTGNGKRGSLTGKSPRSFLWDILSRSAG